MILRGREKGIVSKLSSRENSARKESENVICRQVKKLEVEAICLENRAEIKDCEYAMRLWIPSI